MRRAYQKPCAKRVHFNFEKVVAASGCRSSIYLTEEGGACSSMTPDQVSPFAPKAASLTSEPCGWQKNQN